MINVELIASTDVSPTVLGSHAAKVCYTANVPEKGGLIDVENRLFKTGHHTTLQHNYFTFCLDNISISAITFGLHMASCFYNSDQRSGRFSKMFDNPDMNEIKSYLEAYYPEKGIDTAIKFIEKGVKIYADNIGKLTKLAAETIKKERPFANEKYIEQNAPKFAQEQLRAFVSLAFPTAMDFTINISTLSALYRVAWSNEMRDVTNKMAKLIIEKYPDIAYMFEEDKRVNQNWSINALGKRPDIAFKPELEVLNINIDDNYEIWDGAKDTVDLLQFSPWTMENSINNIETIVEMSATILGHDQRHRSIKRSMPEFTGRFYVPPLLAMAGLEDLAKEYISEFIGLANVLSPELLTAITPYGAMFKFKKLSPLNGLIHEQEKRSCWCAQEEIYHLATALRSELDSNGKYKKLTDRLCPPCYKDGKCIEGVRYCGRNIKTDKSEYFQDRDV